MAFIDLFFVIIIFFFLYSMLISNLHLQLFYALSLCLSV
uniref:Uncharacterized protein n=1 Tax=Rhizophora mucronata TaxID=61149 RepID=A0A2P2N171_RHIMU